VNFQQTAMNIIAGGNAGCDAGGIQAYGMYGMKNS